MYLSQCGIVVEMGTITKQSVVITNNCYIFKQIHSLSSQWISLYYNKEQNYNNIN